MLAGFMVAFLLLAPAEVERVEYVITRLLSEGFTRQEAEALFHDPRLDVYPRRDVAPRQIDWDKIIAGMVAPPSVKEGSEFMARYRETLAGAENKFGVAQGVIAAVLRLESNFGRNTGNYIVFNIFYTLLSQQEEERRWQWAGDNLAALVSFCRNTKKDCFAVHGSYGGALGAAQFLPHSVLQFGADGDGDAVVDPFQMEDAIFSAANFLVQHGWHENPVQALGKYYGSSVGYPRAVLAYAEALRESNPEQTAPAAAVVP
jgi:membrane-bound lytic murein transglycosylase B